jgi:hypothetical protein
MTAKKWNRFYDLIMLGWWGRRGPCFSRGASHFDFHTHVIRLCPSLAWDVRNTNKNILKKNYNKNNLKNPSCTWSHPRADGRCLPTCAYQVSTLVPFRRQGISCPNVKMCACEWEQCNC